LSNPSPLTLVAISTPRRPSSSTARLNSVTAAATSCNGTVANPISLSGSVAAVSAIASLTARAQRTPMAGSSS
jgi:hypothetical protein